MGEAAAGRCFSSDSILTRGRRWVQTSTLLPYCLDQGEGVTGLSMSLHCHGEQVPRGKWNGKEHFPEAPLCSSTGRTWQSSVKLHTHHILPTADRPQEGRGMATSASSSHATRGLLAAWIGRMLCTQ